MCPGCMTAAAVVAADEISAGGLLALVLKKFRAATGANASGADAIAPTPRTAGEQDGSSPNRVAL
jgi:hypothetical protein